MLQTFSQFLTWRDARRSSSSSGSNNAVIFLHNLNSEPVEVRFTLKEDFFDLLSGFILAYIYIAISNTFPMHGASYISLVLPFTKGTAGVSSIGRSS
jgi:hypothetical protein